MKLFKYLKKTMLIISVTYIAIGVLMIVKKDNGNQLIFELLAYGLIIAGALSMIRYFAISVKERIKRNDFVVGALLLAIAAFILLSKNDISYLVSKVLAVAMIMSGIHKFQDLFDTLAINRHNVGLYLFGFAFCAGLGLLVLFDVIKNVNVLYVLIGIGMCVCGISDIVSNFYISYAINEYIIETKDAKANDDNSEYVNEIDEKEGTILK